MSIYAWMGAIAGLVLAVVGLAELYRMFEAHRMFRFCVDTLHVDAIDLERRMGGDHEPAAELIWQKAEEALFLHARRGVRLMDAYLADYPNEDAVTEQIRSLRAHFELCIEQTERAQNDPDKTAFLFRIRKPPFLGAATKQALANFLTFRSEWNKLIKGLDRILD